MLPRPRALAPAPGRAPGARPIADFLLALADPTRLRIVFTIGDGERSLAELADAAGLARDRTWRQLAHLRRAGIVACRRAAGSVRFRIANPDVFTICTRLCGPSGRHRPDGPSGEEAADPD